MQNRSFQSRAQHCTLALDEALTPMLGRAPSGGFRWVPHPARPTFHKPLCSSGAAGRLGRFYICKLASGKALM